MKVVRASLYQDPYSVRGQNPNDPAAPVNQPMSMVARDVDLKVTPDDALMEQKIGSAQTGGFCTGEVFSVLSGAGSSIQQVTIVAERRRQRRAQVEVHQSMLFYYVAGFLPRSTPGGVIAQTVPTPLKRPDVEEVLRLLAEHPDYNHQRLISIAVDGQVITMQDGVIS